jgi:hypothetical protein
MAKVWLAMLDRIARHKALLVTKPALFNRIVL